MSLDRVNALKNLFGREPFTWLLDGSHCSLILQPSQIRIKDDIHHSMERFEAREALQDEMKELMKIVLAGNEALDVAVNGQEFALTEIPVVREGGKEGPEFMIVARHRLSLAESQKFNATLRIMTG
jgi:hypothetical protein